MKYNLAKRSYPKLEHYSYSAYLILCKKLQNPVSKKNLVVYTYIFVRGSGALAFGMGRYIWPENSYSFTTLDVRAHVNKFRFTKDKTENTHEKWNQRVW